MVHAVSVVYSCEHRTLIATFFSRRYLNLESQRPPHPTTHSPIHAHPPAHTCARTHASTHDRVITHSHETCCSGRARMFTQITQVLSTDPEMSCVESGDHARSYTSSECLRRTVAILHFSTLPISSRVSAGAVPAGPIFSISSSVQIMMMLSSPPATRKWPRRSRDAACQWLLPFAGYWATHGCRVAGTLRRVLTRCELGAVGRKADAVDSGGVP